MALFRHGIILSHLFSAVSHILAFEAFIHPMRLFDLRTEHFSERDVIS